MKTLDEIHDAFCMDVPIGAKIRILLHRGYETEYNHKSKAINIRPAKKLIFGAPLHELIGRFSEYFDWEGSGDGYLEFDAGRGYSFSLRCGQIRDYEIIYE